MSYEIVYSRHAQKDAKILAKSNLKGQAEELLAILKQDPFHSPPRWEALRGALKGCYSRRINIQHRLVYEVLEEQKFVHVLKMWGSPPPRPVCSSRLAPRKQRHATSDFRLGNPFPGTSEGGLDNGNQL